MVLPEEDGPNPLDGSILTVRMAPSTAISTFVNGGSWRESSYCWLSGQLANSFVSASACPRRNRMSIARCFGVTPRERAP
jgi:hypothetical protein